MKKIDRLLLISFIPPFLVTFGIATFVLLMQILWVYIDDIAGKGLSMLMIIELLSYKAVGLVPMALPLAILISSVMVMGGLAERYELSSLKSAGISLLRVMQPLIWFGAGAMVLSYLCNDYIIPVANLNFGSRMYDIREKKPNLNLEAGVFNDDFGNYAIRVGEKGKDGKTIEDVLIYDHTESNSDKLSQVIAENGEMYASPDGNYFIMQLYNGYQYVETKPSSRSKGSGYPFIRTSFGAWQKVFDLSEFQLLKTDAALFSQNRSMMSISQLADKIDTIQVQIDKRYYTLARHVGTQFTLFSPEKLLDTGLYQSVRVYYPQENGQQDTSNVDSTIVTIDTIANNSTGERVEEIADDTATRDKGALPPSTEMLEKRRAAALENATARTVKSNIPIYRFNDTLITVKEWLGSLSKPERRRFMTKAKSKARAILSQAESAQVSLNRTKEDKVKHIYEMHTKYSMAVVCIIFIFIGAPLGAIVRKGGFGYPLLVSVVAFIVFIVLTIFCRKIAETFLVPAVVAAWLPCLILGPISLWLTFTAMRGGKLLNTTIVSDLVLAISKWWESRKSAKSAAQETLKA